MAGQGLVKNGLLLTFLVVSAVHGHRPSRSDDPDALASVVEQLSANYDALLTTVTDLQSQMASQQALIEQLQEEKQRRVAFTAYIPEGTDASSSTGGIIPFRSVIVNIGNAFNVNTAVFTAPYDGDYFFAVNLQTNKENESVSLRRNNVVVVVADRDDHVSTLLSTSAVVSLSAGDVVTVNHEHSSGYVDTGLDSVVTGFML